MKSSQIKLSSDEKVRRGEGEEKGSKTVTFSKAVQVSFYPLIAQKSNLLNHADEFAQS